METFYLVDFENVHNEGIANVKNITKNDHVHIFFTQNAKNIRKDIKGMKNRDINFYEVPARKQSLDMHLVSYLGYLLCKHGKKCTYIIVSKDKDYDNIIKFWKEKGYSNIFRKETLFETEKFQIELSRYMQDGLIDKGYYEDEAKKICKHVIAHCNDDQMLDGIRNDKINDKELKKFDDDYVINDVKVMLIRYFLERHFKKNIYKDYKEEIIDILLNAETKMQVNNALLKLYSDGDIVKHIYKTVQPLIKDLPEK